MKNWKLLGLAGLAGVAATGVVIIRAERRRQAFTPDDVRARLHHRYEAAGPGAEILAAAAVEAAAPVPDGSTRFWHGLRWKWRRPTRQVKAMQGRAMNLAGSLGYLSWRAWEAAVALPPRL